MRNGLIGLLVLLSYQLASAECQNHMLTLTGPDGGKLLVRAIDISTVQEERGSLGTNGQPLTLLTLHTMSQRTVGGGRSDFFGRTNAKVITEPQQLYVREPVAAIQELLTQPPESSVMD